MLHQSLVIFTLKYLVYPLAFVVNRKGTQYNIHCVTAETNIFSLAFTTRLKQEKRLHNSFFPPGNKFTAGQICAVKCLFVCVCVFF